MSLNPTVQTPKVRLKFIDMARSIAILLMLEGHFIDNSLLLEARDPNNGIYATWAFMRHFTAPIFLTVTGLIFVYLLLKERDEILFQNIRFKKGIKRVGELFIWGFIVQYNAFHVLECIAVGIFAILLIFAIYKLIKFVPLWVYFFVAGTVNFALFPVVKEMHLGMTYPEEIWLSVSSLFHSDSNIVVLFPTVSFVGFTMFGAMIGALIYDLHSHIKKIYFPLTFTLIGVSFYFFSPTILGTMDVVLESVFTSTDFQIAGLRRLYEKMGMVLIFLSILIYIDNFFGAKIKSKSLFLKIGQNTLTIYVIHMLLLYMLVDFFGLTNSLRQSLSPWKSAIGAVGFILFFILLIKHLEAAKSSIGKILDWTKAGLNFIIDRLKNKFT